MKVNKLLVPLAFSMLFGSGIATAADFNKGWAAWLSGDFKTALAEWTPLAEQGDAAAQIELGLMYENGQGVLENDKTAVKWYTKAAEQGYFSAQGALGLMYEYGDGVLTDNRRAYMWYNLASYNGSKVGGKSKNELAEKMTPADISKAQDMSSLCLESNYTDC